MLSSEILDMMRKKKNDAKNTCRTFPIPKFENIIEEKQGAPSPLPKQASVNADSTLDLKYLDDFLEL